ncbi:hypothetical protein PSJ90_01450 [Escherichia coli]|nr:hypothetical protein [Escherichia coli]
MVTLKAHILPHHDLQPPGCRGSVIFRFLAAFSLCEIAYCGERQ